MSVQYVTGNLFDNKYKVQAFAHGCNLQGVMGAGIAKEFRYRWPEMYEYYRKECLSNSPLQPGECLPYFALDEDSNVIVIFNLMTQIKVGPNARYEYIEQALKEMKNIADNLYIESIAMPAIGCGIGGLQWSLVTPLIDSVFGNWGGSLFVYKPHSK